VTRWERRAFIDHLDLPGPCRPIQNDWTPFLPALHLTASQLRVDLVAGSRMLVLGSALRLANLCIESRPNAVSFASAFTTVTPRYQSINQSAQAANLLATMNPTPIRFALDFDLQNSSSLIAVLVPDYASISLSGSRLARSIAACQATSWKSVILRYTTGLGGPLERRQIEPGPDSGNHESSRLCPPWIPAV
jgi:hypothetical protein